MRFSRRLTCGCVVVREHAVRAMTGWQNVVWLCVAVAATKILIFRVYSQRGYTSNCRTHAKKRATRSLPPIVVWNPAGTRDGSRLRDESRLRIYSFTFLVAYA